MRKLTKCNGPTLRFRKIYKGKSYYFSFPQGTPNAAHKAYHQWMALRHRLTSPNPLQEALTAYCALLESRVGLTLSPLRCQIQSKYASQFVALDSELIEYYSTLMNEIKRGETSSATAKDKFQCARAFLRFAFDNGFMTNKPSDTHFPFPVNNKISILSIDELREQIHSYPLTLLACNFGLTGKDINQLTNESLAGSYLIHKRTKTERFENVPTVSFLIWQETRAAFLQGGTLPNNLRQVRKTCATLVEDSEYGRYVPYFLGHSNKSIAQKHYVIPSQSQFDLALAFLKSKLIG
ncbi:MAG: hypothetical protein K2X29_05395 [Candidatus Obscuribacterales bacterium]|nr:hypothetical protein [Candidatus Obscuribacterales bacterium]